VCFVEEVSRSEPNREEMFRSGAVRRRQEKRTSQALRLVRVSGGRQKKVACPLHNRLLHPAQRCERKWCCVDREMGRALVMEWLAQLGCRSGRGAIEKVLLCAFLFCLQPGRADGQIVLREARLKAIHVKNMLGFVQWPEEYGKSMYEVIRVCVVGDQFLEFALLNEVKVTKPGERKLQVTWVKGEEEVKGCQVLYIGSADKRRIARLLGAAKGTKVLTIGEAEGFLEAGGIVQLGYEEGVVQFQVNLAAARSEGLKIDARLLGMAKRVVKSSDSHGG
jgi:uncharacterized protein DUF4154